MKKSIFKTREGVSFLFPFILITTLFFLWGFAHSILDILNKHFQEVLVISKAKSAMVQAVVYGGYFLMALPSGAFIKRFGYRWGVILGLFLYGVGAFLFIPGNTLMNFNFFLFSLFIIGCGLTCLETAANPYVTILGDSHTAASRLNLSQAFNGLGWIVGPLVGGLVVFNEDGSGGDISVPYMVIGCVVLVIAIVFLRLPLPEIQEEEIAEDTVTNRKSVWHYPHFVFGVIALFFYVAAQTGINSFFINYMTESMPEVTNRDASLLLSFGGMGLFMVGRLLGSWIMSRMQASVLLFICSVGAAITMLLVVLNLGVLSVIALVACYLFESIMFPTIFALAVRKLGVHTKKASSFLIMSIVGGAVAPVVMGLLGENNMAVGFIIPLFCFLVVMAYALTGYKIKSERINCA